MSEENRTITRRSFMQLTALGAASLGVGLAGCSSAVDGAGAASKGAASDNGVWDIEPLGTPTETITTQVCVVGGGGTGMAAGVAARQAGLDTVLIEKHSVTGGSFVGTEGLFAVGSHWQKAAGETVTASDVIQECMDYHHWVPDYGMYKAFFNKTAGTVDWLESIGVQFDHVQSLGDSHVCWHIYKGSIHPGVEFMQSMLAAAKTAGLDIETKCAGKQLIMKDGKVAGVLALRDDGTVVEIDAPVVILATGGYSNNSDIVSYLTGLDPDFLMSSGVNGRDADGIKMAHEKGAALAPDPGTIMFYGPVAKGSAWGNMLCACTLQPIVWVNEKGERFVREDMFLKNFAFAGLAMKKQKKTFAILTQAMIDRFEAGAGALAGVGVYVAEGAKLTGLKDEIKKVTDDGTGEIYKAGSISELAKATGIDADSLKKNIDEYNSYCGIGLDEDFHKPQKYMVGLKDSDGPYYAIGCQDAYFTTCGGLKVTPQTEVLDQDGKVIQGLYAGGCDTGGFFGDAYDVGIAAGSGASWAINSGRIAAEQAASYIK